MEYGGDLGLNYLGSGPGLCLMLDPQNNLTQVSTWPDPHLLSVPAPKLYGTGGFHHVVLVWFLVL